MDSPTSPTLDTLVIPDFPSIQSEKFKKEVVIPYFKDIYRDLASRSDKKSAGINRVTIIEYCNLPGILAERFFDLLDANNDEYIDLKEFVYVLFKIYYSNFDEQVKLTFDIYDFDHDGVISKEDVRIILSYIPALSDSATGSVEKEGVFSTEGGGKEEFSDRIKIQEEISELLDIVFKEKDEINLEEFQKFNETISSDMLVTVLSLLRDKLPCSEKFYQHQEDFRTKMEEDEETDIKIDLSKETKTKSIASPSILKSLSPLARTSSLNERGENKGAMSYLRKIAREDSSTEETKGISDDQIQLDKFKSNKKRKDGEANVADADGTDSPTVSADVVRLANKNQEPKSLLEQSKTKNIFASPTSFLSGTRTIKVDSESEEDKDKEETKFEGEMMRKAKENKLKKYWYTLIEKELYVYKAKDDKKHKTMINLVGVFLKIEPDEPLDKKNTLYPFSLIFPNKERTFYLLTKKDREEWVSNIKKAIGYANLFDYYDVKEAIGKGKFGTIKLGIHK